MSLEYLGLRWGLSRVSFKRKYGNSACKLETERWSRCSETQHPIPLRAHFFTRNLCFDLGCLGAEYPKLSGGVLMAEMPPGTSSSLIFLQDYRNFCTGAVMTQTISMTCVIRIPYRFEESINQFSCAVVAFFVGHLPPE